MTPLSFTTPGANCSGGDRINPTGRLMAWAPSDAMSVSALAGWSAESGNRAATRFGSKGPAPELRYGRRGRAAADRETRAVSTILLRLSKQPPPKVRPQSVETAPGRNGMGPFGVRLAADDEGLA